MIYQTRRLIDGFKIDPKLSGKKVIAINANKYKLLGLKDQLKVTVNETGEVYILSSDIKPVKRIRFKDKFGRGDYYLLYFVAKPELKELTLFSQNC